MPLTLEEIEDLRAEHKKDVQKDIDETKRIVEERHKQLIATLQSMQQQQSGRPYQITAKDLMLDLRELKDRSKEMTPGKSVNFELQTKAITGVSSQVADWTGIVAGLPMVPTPVRNLLPLSQTQLGAITWVRKDSYTPAAAIVAEGAQKPEATAAVSVQTSPLIKIAVWMKLSKETYDDLPALVSELQNELFNDVKKAEEAYLLTSAGGLYTSAPALPMVPLGTSYIDQIGAGISHLVNLGVTPDGIIANPVDWQAAKQSKTQNLEYLFGPPTQVMPDRLWGLPVAVSSALTSPQWLVGGFREGTLLAERATLNVMISLENQDDFVKNLVTALAELREVLIIKQVTTLVKNGTISPTAATTTTATSTTKRP